jgi:hypothetical protein
VRAGDGDRRLVRRRNPLDRAIYDAVADVIAAELPDGEVEIEALGVGVMFKRARTFAELRPRRRGLALSLVLDELLVSTRVTRTLKMQRATRAGYVVPLMSPGDVDDELAAWIVRSFEDAAPRRR